MTVVAFSATNFKTRYPEFAGVADGRLQACFDEAGLYLANTDSSIVQNIPKRTLLLNMLTAHIAFVSGALSVDGQTRPVGRVSQAGEGSVNAAFEGPPPGSAQWFQQTQYGASFWQATSNLRGFKYISNPTTW